LNTKEDGFNYSLLRRSLGNDLVRFTVGLLGSSEWSARLSPALIGVISIPLLYFLARRCMGRSGALMVVALLALSPWHLYWSQNARFYSLLFLFFNLGLLLFYLGFEEDRPLLLLGALLMFGMAARERLTALMGLPAVTIYLMLVVLLRFERPKGLNRRNLLIFFAPMILAGLVFIFPYASNLSAWFQGFGRINNSPFFLLAGTMYYIGLPVAVFAAGAGFTALLVKNRLALLLVLSAVLPLGMIMAISLVQYTANRYIFFSLLSWLVLAGMGIKTIAERLPAGSRLLVLLVAAVLLAGNAGDVFLYHTQQNGNRDNWRAAFAYIDERREPGDVVVSADIDIASYYLGEAGQLHFGWFSPERISAARRVWFVEDMIVTERYPEQREWMLKHTRPMAAYDVRLPGRTYLMRVYLLEGN
jgi:4-amino-4-deoxy-L-arabinose transferase-like glycosyltransferase